MLNNTVETGLGTFTVGVAFVDPRVVSLRQPPGIGLLFIHLIILQKSLNYKTFSLDKRLKKIVIY